MQVRVKIGEQYGYLECQAYQMGKFIYDQIASFQQSDQNNFHIQVQTQNGNFVLDRNKTLQQQNIGQNTQLILIQNNALTNQAQSGQNQMNQYNQEQAQGQLYNQQNPISGQNFQNYDQNFNFEQNKAQFPFSPNSSDNGQFQNQQIQPQGQPYQKQASYEQQQAPNNQQQLNFFPQQQPAGASIQQQSPIEFPGQQYPPLELPGQQQSPLGFSDQQYPSLGFPGHFHLQPPLGPLGLSGQQQSPLGLFGQQQSPLGLPSQQSLPLGLPGQLQPPLGLSGQQQSPLGLPGQLQPPLGLPGQQSLPLGLPGQLQPPFGIGVSQQPNFVQPQYPFPQDFNKNQNTFNFDISGPPQILDTIHKDKQQVQKDKQYDLLKQQKEYIESQLDDVTSQSKDKDKKIQNLKNEINRLNEKYNHEIEEMENKYNSKQNEIKYTHLSEINNLKKKINTQNGEISELRNENDLLRDENDQLRRKTNPNIQIINPQPNINEQDQLQITKLRKQVQDLSKQISEKNQKIENFEQETQDLFRQLENVNKQANTDQFQKNQNFNDLIQQQAQKLRQLEAKVDELQHQAFVEQKKREDRDKEICRLKQKVEDLQNLIDIKEIEIKNDKKIIDYLKDQSQQIQAGQNRQQAELNQHEELQRLQQNMQNEIYQKKKQDEEKKEEEKKRLAEQNAERIQIKKERDLQYKLEKQKKAMKLREIIMNTQGILQVGLLVDVTGSMDKYKDATMNIIQRSMECIKSQTNRDCEWGAVCYQDFAELKQKGQYLQHQFTRNGNAMMNFLKNITCDGGDDGAEDLRNGIKQMVNNLTWGKFFKIVLLICDAPSHGKKWAGNVLDDYPNEDLGDALQQLINKNIVLIGIEFTSSTEVMFAQMKNYYANQNKQSMLIVVDLKNKPPGQIQDQLINIISEASISITEVSQAGTKSKKENVKRDGAFEALVKLLPDPTKFNLDPKITTIQTKFNVYRVEINQEAFEKNITSIFKIKIPEDYSITHESEWNCIRTLKPFAFGQLKEVYLMKKIENSAQNEVYVIKMPIGGQTYKTMNEAMLECRSHLISKRLMQKFIQNLNDKNCKALPIRYSDFLILKEHETSYWIAERFFQGEFIKFNNNFGYINPQKDLIYILAQVFSYYTYHISDFQYLVCDIQGVGYNFTDPAINTAEGQLDDTDQGPEGIGQFIISFDKDKEQLYKKYLNDLELN